MQESADIRRINGSMVRLGNEVELRRFVVKNQHVSSMENH